MDRRLDFKRSSTERYNELNFHKRAFFNLKILALRQQSRHFDLHLGFASEHLDLDPK